MATTAIRGANNGTGTSQIQAATVSNADIHASAAIASSKLASWSADRNANSNKLTNLADPTAAQDAATKAYVDATAVGLDVKPSMRLATDAALASNSRSGNILTASANGVLGAIDGVTPAVNDRILVKNEATGANNGLYYVSSVGSGGTPWTMTRTTDSDTSAEVTSGLYTFIEEGTVNADAGYILSTNNPITLNTTTLTFVQFSGAGAITAGAGLTKTGATLDVVAADASITVNADSIQLAYSGNPAASAVGDSVAQGASVYAARTDHVHAREAFATPTIALGSSAAGGAASTPIRSDATIAAFDATSPTTSAVGDAAAVGSAAFAARRDHVHGREAFATNTVVLGSAAAAGSAATLIRSDATIAAFDVTSPSTQAIGDSAVVGTAAFAARRDHKHAMPAFATNTVALGTAAAAGAAATLIRSDATIAAFDATVPTTSAVADAAATGSAAFAARRDHVHGREAFATPSGTSRPGASNAAGAATTLPRSDHAHARESWAFNEVPSGSVNGSNKTFTLANTPNPSSVIFTWNGLVMKPGASMDYALSTATITIDAAVTAPQTGDTLLASYIY